MDSSFHYPPELFQLLVDTIPRLCPYKKDVLMFFRGAGVPSRLLADLQQQLNIDRGSINKFDMARTVLKRINEGGDSLLASRREVIRRVEEYEDFSTCWENDRLKAQGLVAEIRRVRNVKDSFTRMAQEREKERIDRQRLHVDDLNAKRKKQEELDGIKADFYALFGMDNEPNKRGTLLESVLNRLFKTSGILVRESFRRSSETTGRVLEQIDGVVEIDGEIYLVEMKWLSEKVSIEDVSRHIVRVYTRDGSRGIFISATDYTEAALTECKGALSQKIMVLSTLEELVRLLDAKRDLAAFLKEKVRAAIIDKIPFYLIRS